MDRFWNISNIDETTAELMLYGVLSDESWYGDEVTPKQFAADLQALNGKNINVHINSPGGDVFAGQAIYTQLKNYTGTVNVMIDGMCASAATIVAMAGDTVSMPQNAILMIHNPTVGVMGALDEPALAKLQASLKAVKQTIVNVYLKRCNLSEQQIKNMMDKETWMTAKEALGYGFIDAISDSEVENDAVFKNCIMYAQKKYINFKKDGEKMAEKDMSVVDEIKNLLNKFKKSDTGVDAKAIAIAERERIVALNALRNGNNYVAQIVDKAIGDGKKAEDVKDYIDIVANAAKELEEAKKASKVVTEMITDQMQSGAQNVQASVSNPQKSDTTKEEDIDMVSNAMSRILNKK